MDETGKVSEPDRKYFIRLLENLGLEQELADRLIDWMDRDIEVRVPGGDCLLTTASIPGSNRQKLLRALPYALEDQLTVDVEDLHFALGPSLGDDRYAVAVIAIERMEAILEACRQAEMDVGRILPEQLAIPCPDTGTCVVIDNEVALVRTGRHAGYAIDTGNLGLLLSRQQPEAEESAPELRIFKASGTDLPDLGAAAGTAVVEEYHGSPMGLLAAGAGSPTIDLLQGPYSRSQEWGKLWRPWRATAALLLAGFVVSHAVMGVEYYRLSKEREALGKRIEETYRQAFPAAKRVVNPRAQMQQQLDQLLVETALLEWQLGEQPRTRLVEVLGVAAVARNKRRYASKHGLQDHHAGQLIVGGQHQAVGGE